MAEFNHYLNMPSSRPERQSGTYLSPSSPTRVAIDSGLLQELDGLKPAYMDRQTWVNFLLDAVIRLDLSGSIESYRTGVENESEALVASRENINASNSFSTVHSLFSKLKEQKTTTTINNFYGDSSIVEPTTGQPKQKKETGDEKPNNTLEHAADIYLEQLRLEEINRPLTQEAKKFAQAIKEGGKLKPVGFDAFWTIYQSCPSPDLRVAGQSKVKAKEQYRLKLKETSHQSLLEAAEKAVDHQMQCQRRQEWVAPLPDAFRWLRDDRFQVWLDQIEERQQKKGDWL